MEERGFYRGWKLCDAKGRGRSATDTVETGDQGVKPQGFTQTDLVSNMNAELLRARGETWGRKTAEMMAS